MQRHIGEIILYYLQICVGGKEFCTEILSIIILSEEKEWNKLLLE
jgi:hypothetical protein